MTLGFRGLWLLTLTDAGERAVPSYEVNAGFVVCAIDEHEARVFASHHVIDEDADIWLSNSFSNIKRIGAADPGTPLGVVLKEDNAT